MNRRFFFVYALQNIDIYLTNVQKNVHLKHENHRQNPAQ